MNFRSKVLVFLFGFLPQLHVFAAEMTTEKELDIGTPEAAPDKADQLITNRRFRAQTGSLSKWSLATTWDYLAGSLSQPFDATRPNLNNQSDIPSIQSIVGELNVSYRLTEVDRFNLGIGFQTLAPFHNSIETSNPNVRREFDANQGSLDFNDPTFGYTRVMKLAGIQTIWTTEFTSYTTGNLTDVGFGSRFRTLLNTIYDFGNSGLSAGLYFLGAQYFNDDGIDTEAARSRKLGTEFAILPQVEYVINDTFNLRTISRAWWYQQNEFSGEYNRLAFTQSVGLGIAVTRDIFLYPNIQFAPDNLQADATNVGINANINLF